MSKFFKRALGLAAVGGAVAAGVAYYLKKEDNSDDFLDEFDDDFSEREYVPLNTAPKAEAEEDKTEETVTPSEEKNAEDTEETAEAEAAEEKAE